MWNQHLPTISSRHSPPCPQFLYECVASYWLDHHCLLYLALKYLYIPQESNLFLGNEFTRVTNMTCICKAVRLCLLTLATSSVPSTEGGADSWVTLLTPRRSTELPVRPSPMIPVILERGRYRQESWESAARFVYTVRPASESGKKEEEGRTCNSRENIFLYRPNISGKSYAKEQLYYTVVSVYKPKF